MKVTKIMEEFTQLSSVDLQEKVNGFRRDMFSIKLNAMTAHVKDYSQFKKLKRTIARALTVLNKKEQK